MKLAFISPRWGGPLTALVLLSSPVLLQAALADRMETANAALASGRPNEALADYKEILASPELAKSSSAELWYNRGLAEEKKGESAASSLSFRRALLLDPGFTPARRQLVTVLEKIGVSAPLSWQEKLLGLVHPETMILVGTVAGWIGVMALVVLLVGDPRRKGLIALAIFLAAAGHGCSAFGTMIDPRRTAGSKAVVISRTSPVLRATPADSATSSGSLPPGTLITVLSRNGDWWYVASGSGLTGWIPSETASSLLPSVAVSSTGS